ncbi:MAG: hypothetical protein L6E13_01050 [Firmicutes bacterium]|nr:hypothetical protein [Bacillota bacterium]
MEQLRNLRWPLVMASLAVTVAVLWAGQILVRGAMVDEPVAAYLKSHPAVESFAWEETPEGPRLRIALGPVPDLAQVYTDLEEGVRRAARGRAVALVVTDHRTPGLVTAFYHINPLLQEALATGRYGDLVDRVEAAAARLGVERAEVRIDQARVYLQLHHGADYLYAVLPRPDGPRWPGAEPAPGGWGL